MSWNNLFLDLNTWCWLVLVKTKRVYSDLGQLPSSCSHFKSFLGAHWLINYLAFDPQPFVTELFPQNCWDAIFGLLRGANQGNPKVFSFYSMIFVLVPNESIFCPPDCWGAPFLRFLGHFVESAVEFHTDLLCFTDPFLLNFLLYSYYQLRRMKNNKTPNVSLQI